MVWKNKILVTTEANWVCGSMANRVKICPGLNANEIQIPNDKHQQVSSLVKKPPKHTQLSNMK